MKAETNIRVTWLGKALPTPCFWTSGLQNREGIYVRCFRLPRLCSLSRRPQEANGAGGAEEPR